MGRTSSNINDLQRRVAQLEENDQRKHEKSRILTSGRFVN